MPYFDHNATTPLHPAARAAWLAAADDAWHNPSGLTGGATRAHDLLEDCRERLADLLGCGVPSRVVFTSGATAANNLLARHLGRTSPADAVVLLSPLEHPAVQAAFHAAFPGRVVEAEVDRDGVLTVAGLERAIGALGGRRVACVSVMAASNESGVLQPWGALAACCHAHQIPFHTDASQWIGKLPVAGLGGCDWVTGSAHKFGGPRGVGFLLVPDAGSFRGDVGGPQEDGRHAGTENLSGIAGMVAALEVRDREVAATAVRGASFRDAASERLLRRVPEAMILGLHADRLWNTLAVVLPGADSRKLVAALDRAGIEASTGSACSSGGASTARVVAAVGHHLGLAPGQPAGMIRLSAGPDTTAAEWLAAVDALADAVAAAPRPPRLDLR